MRLSSILLLLVLLLCSSCHQVKQSKAPEQSKLFVNSHLAAEVFNRWENDEVTAQEQTTKTELGLEHSKLQEIHNYIVSVENLY